MADGDGAGVPPAAVAGEELSALVGRLRRWHPNGDWGFVFSELHQCDVFVEVVFRAIVVMNKEGEDVSGELQEGDLVLFEAFDDEDGQLSARRCRRAAAREVEHRLKALEPHLRRDSAAANLPGQQATELACATSAVAGVERHGGAGVHLPSGASRPPPMGPAPAEGVLLPLPSAAPSQPGALLPPPPAHPAPSGPAGLRGQPPPQGCGAVPQQGYPQAHPAYGLDGRASQPQHWQGPGAVARLAPAEPRSGDVVLAAPPVLFVLEPMAVACKLRGVDQTIRRAHTMATRGGALAQVGQSWCNAIRLAWQVGSMLGEGLGAPGPELQLWGQQPAHAPLQHQQQHMLGMAGVDGDHSMYQAAQAG